MVTDEKIKRESARRGKTREVRKSEGEKEGEKERQTETQVEAER